MLMAIPSVTDGRVGAAQLLDELPSKQRTDGDRINAAETIGFSSHLRFHEDLDGMLGKLDSLRVLATSADTDEARALIAKQIGVSSLLLSHEQGALTARMAQTLGQIAESATTDEGRINIARMDRALPGSFTEAHEDPHDRANSALGALERLAAGSSPLVRDTITTTRLRQSLSQTPTSYEEQQFQVSTRSALTRLGVNVVEPNASRSQAASRREQAGLRIASAR